MPLSEHDEAVRCAEIDRLPKMVVTRSGFAILATQEGWHADTIRILLTGILPKGYNAIGANAVKIVEHEDDPEFREAVEEQLKR